METTQGQPGSDATTAVADAPDTSTSQPVALADLEGASLEQLDEMLSTGKMTLPPKPGSEGKTQDKPPAAKKVETESGEQPAAVEAEAEAVVGDEPVVEAEAEAEAEAEEEAPVAEEEPVQGLERARFKDERDQLVVGIYKEAQRKGKPISWADAESRVDGPKSEEAPVVEAVAPVDHAAVIGTLETQLSDINGKLDGFEEGLSTKEIRDLQAEQQRTERKLETAKADQQKAADAAKAKSKANRETAHAQAIAEFPAAADDNTELGKALTKRIAELNDPSHPDHATLWADRAPLLIARDVAAELGIAPVAKKKAASPPVTQKVEAPPRKVVAPAPGSKTSVQPVQTAEDGKAQLNEVLTGDKVDLATLDAIQGMPDPSKLLVGANR